VPSPAASFSCYSSFAVYVVVSRRTPPPPSSALFPYTTLFRSLRQQLGHDRRLHIRGLARAAGPEERLHLVEEDHDGEAGPAARRSEEHTSELQSRFDLVCRLLLEKKKYNTQTSKRTEEN